MKNKIPKDVLLLKKIFDKAGYELYLVGGCVRDMLLKEEPHDWDMCTNATPDVIEAILDDYAFFYLTVGLKHGTITVVLNGENYEITTYRIDGDYSDGRHPDEVKFTNLLEKDLSRRDFTMNAMAMNPVTMELKDPFHGREALETHMLKAVGNAEKRLQEDALRMLRALRFAVKYDLTIDDDLAKAIRENAESINKISKERITDEFRKLFDTGKPISKVFKENKELITAIIPEMEPCMHFKQNNKYHKHDVYEHILAVVDLCDSNKFEIRMAALLHDIGKPASCVHGEDGYDHYYGHPAVSAKICETLLKERFVLSTKEYERILELVKYHDMEISETKKSVKKALNKHSEDFMRDWFILKQADMDDHIYPDEKHIKTVANLISIMEEILSENAAFSLKQLAVNGDILMKELNMKPNKMIGVILHQLLSDVIDEKVANTKESLLEEAKEISKNK